MLLSEFINNIEQIAPPMLAEKWDNPGLQLGDPNCEVESVLVSLDIHQSVIEEAIQKKVQLIFTHHPFIFKPLHSINRMEWQGKFIYQLIDAKLSLFSAHTNLDGASEGLNAIFAKEIGLANTTPLIEHPSGLGGTGIMGEFPTPLTLKQLADQLKELFQLSELSYFGDTDQTLTKVGICAGSGSSLIDRAANLECQLFITGDLTYHNYQLAERRGICLLNLPHYQTERKLLETVVKQLQNRFNSIEFIMSEENIDPRYTL